MCAKHFFHPLDLIVNTDVRKWQFMYVCAVSLNCLSNLNKVVALKFSNKFCINVCNTLCHNCRIILHYHRIFGMSVVMYFIFVICLCVLATVLTVVVLHLYLRAETHPVEAMPAWVSRDCKKLHSLEIMLQLTNKCGIKSVYLYIHIII